MIMIPQHSRPQLLFASGSDDAALPVTEHDSFAGTREAICCGQGLCIPKVIKPWFAEEAPGWEGEVG